MDLNFVMECLLLEYNYNYTLMFEVTASVKTWYLGIIEIDLHKIGNIITTI